MNNQGVAALTDQHFDGIALFFRLMIAIADQDIFLMLLGDHIDRFHQRTEKGVRYIHHHHADGVADLRRKRLGIGIWPVPELGHGFHYGFTGFRADQRAVVQHARDGGHRNARLTGDVTNGDHIHHP